MYSIAKWAGLAALGAVTAFLVNAAVHMIPERDHDGRTGATIVGLLVVCALGLAGVLEDFVNRG